MSVVLFRNNERTASYPFQAASLADAEACMQRLGPRDAEGYHAAAFDILANITDNLGIGPVQGQTVQVRQSPGWVAQAQIVSAVLRYQVVYTFPDWTNVRSLNARIQAEWTRYTNALWTHERGHTQDVTPLLPQYRQQFEELRIGGEGRSGQEAEATARQNLHQQVQEIYNQLTAAVSNRIRDYDRRTNHGRTQGAQLNTRIH